MRVPSLLIATLVTWPVCSLSVRRFLPVLASHTFTLPQPFIVFESHPPLPETMRVSSLLIATLYTGPVCPLQVKRTLPERPSHTTISSKLLLTMRVPSRLIATARKLLVAWPVCSLRVRISLPVRLSHTFTSPSILPLTMRVSSLLIATLFTWPLCPLRVTWLSLNRVNR